MNSRNVKSNFAWLWISFLIYPFGALLFTIKNFEIRKYRLFLVLFGVFYGLSYLPIEGSDANTYSEIINGLGSYPFQKYWYDITHMYNADVEYNDAYIYTVLFIVSKFSLNPIVYRMIFAVIYYSVLIHFVGNVYDYVKANKKYEFVIWFLLGLLFIINLSSGINGVRFPLSLQLFMLGFFKYVTSQNQKYLFFCVAAFLVHFMIGYSLAFLLAFILTKKFYNSVYAILLTLTLFLASLTAGNLITTSTSFLGAGIEQRADSYTTNEDYKEQRNEHLESVNWYIQFNRYSTYYFGILSLVLVIAYRKKLYKDSIALNLEYFAILMFIASFISGQLVDELSNRYYLLANGAFLIYMLYLCSINQSILLKRLTYLYIPICILQILVMMRGDQETLSYNLFIGNIFTELYIGS